MIIGNTIFLTILQSDVFAIAAVRKFVQLLQHFLLLFYISAYSFFYENTLDCNFVTISQKSIFEVKCTVYLITIRYKKEKKKKKIIKQPW